ncbi:hypothetical protein DLM_2131 [Aquitalea magnusonii]|uniref:Uncharacterized protein n=1 Tax=Aquitalea magnusonii TaxID=332411 RepID=A0A3G9GK49_9NEIS|nr:hypothetical protein DLM_2131 [Aquitalea magnusonii]
MGLAFHDYLLSVFSQINIYLKSILMPGMANGNCPTLARQKRPCRRLPPD